MSILGMEGRTKKVVEGFGQYCFSLRLTTHSWLERCFSTVKESLRSICLVWLFAFCALFFSFLLELEMVQTLFKYVHALVFFLGLPKARIKLRLYIDLIDVSPPPLPNFTGSEPSS